MGKLTRPRAGSRTKWWSVPAAILTVALMLFGAMPVPVSAAPAYNVTGKVVDTAGVGLRGLLVTAVRAKDFEGEVAYTRVLHDGSFGFERLPAGDYHFIAGDRYYDDSDNIPLEDHFVSAWFDGEFDSDDFDNAKVYTVGNSGSISLGTLALKRYGAISASVSRFPLPADPQFEAYIQIYNESGERMFSPEPDERGNVTVRVRPGTYTVEFGGFGRDPENVGLIRYVPEWWENSYSRSTATKVVVGEGELVSGLTASLSQNYRALTAPRITGTAMVGKKLTVSKGTWNFPSPWPFDLPPHYYREWKVGGITAGTGSTYKVKAADRGKAITATVLAFDVERYFGDGTATTKAVVAKEMSKLALKAKAGKRKATVTIGLKLPGTSTNKTAGSVKIYDGNKLVKTVKVSKGKASVTLKLKKGKHALKAVYAGSTQYTGSTAVRSVTVK